MDVIRRCFRAVGKTRKKAKGSCHHGTCNSFTKKYAEKENKDLHDEYYTEFQDRRDE
jgi:hypothetical protein